MGAESGHANSDRTHLKQGVRVELIEEVHDGVRVQGGAANDHMLLALRPVRRIGAAQLLPLHPCKCQLFKLKRNIEGNVKIN